MAEIKKGRSISRRAKVNAGVQHFSSNLVHQPSSSEEAPSLFGGGIEREEPEKDVTAQFMREHPKGSIKDDPEGVTGDGGEVLASTFVDDGPLPEGETPESIAEKNRAAQAERAEEEPPAEETTPQGEQPAATAPTAEKPAAKPTEKPAAAPAAKPAAPAAAAKPADKPAEPPPLDLNVKVRLTEDPRDTWTVGQLVDRLRQVPPLEAKAQGLDRVLGVLGTQDVEAAVTNLTRYTTALKENPHRAELIDAIVESDPATLNYVRSLLEHFPNLTAEQKAAFGEVRERAAKPAAAPSDARVERLTKIAMQSRINNEAAVAGTRYPFLRTNPEAAKELERMAQTLHDADVKAGIDPLDARGMLDVLEMNKAAYEAMLITWRASQGSTEHATPNGEPFTEPQPGQAREALLTSSEPEPPGVRTQKPRSKVYRGNDPTSAFEQDFPSRQ